MISKILLTLAVIGIAIAMLRLRQRPVPKGSNQPAQPLMSRWVKVLSLAVISLMIVAAGVFLFLEWQDARQVLQVKVIDSRSGQSVEYQVLKGKLEERSFQTLDGRQVNLAETERLEVQSVP